MPPKSTKDKAPPSSASRKSARLAGSEAPPSELQESNKRSASAPKSGTAAKKAKTTSAAKSQPKSKSKAKPQPIAEEDDKNDSNEQEKAAEEKEEEAPKDASPDVEDVKVIKVGDKLPSIQLQDSESKDVDISKLATGGKGVVIFLYPKADTPGCTTQACGYRDAYDEIKDLGYEIYGLSKDKPAAQQKWRTKKELKYGLLCDPESNFIKKLGAFVLPNNTKRSHFVFDKDGKLVDAQLGVKPKEDPENVLKFIKQHQK